MGFTFNISTEKVNRTNDIVQTELGHLSISDSTKSVCWVAVLWPQIAKILDFSLVICWFVVELVLQNFVATNCQNLGIFTCHLLVRGRASLAELCGNCFHFVVV